MASVPESQWVPDDMVTGCCICHESFSLLRRRHHCRTCGRVVCDDCSSNRIAGDRTCLPCWHRIGRKMSGLVLPASSEGASIDGSDRVAPSAHRSALGHLLKEERYNRDFVLEDGRSVGYAVAGSTDGLPVFVFLGLDAHRHAVGHFEDVARRHGLRLICFDRPGRGKSEATPRVSADPSDTEKDPQRVECEAFEADVVSIVNQMCSKLRIDKAGLLAHSIGSIFAFRCARDEGLRDILEGTVVCLVSPWVPLGGKDVNGLLQGISSTGLKGTLGRIAAGMTMSQTSDLLVWRGPSSASDIERTFLEAPYSQELSKHVCELSENKDIIATVETFIALHNDGEEDAAELCAQVLHPVHIWHGTSDQMVPLGAIRWIEQVLPSCTTTIKAGGTHSLVYDKPEMEGVFVALQKSVSEAWAKHRFTAKRLRSEISYMASSMFASGVAPSPARSGAPPPLSVPDASAPARASPRAGASKPGEGEKRDAGSTSGETAQGEEHEETNGDDGGQGSKVRAAESGLKIFPLPLAAGDSGDAEQRGHQRRGSATSGGSLAGPGSVGSWHSNPGVNSSVHDSSIPEEGEIDWKSDHAGAAIGSGSVLSDVGRQVSRALSDAFGGSDHGSTVSGAGVESVGAGAGAGASALEESYRSDDRSDAGGPERDSEAEASKGGSFLRQMDRMISSLTLVADNNSTREFAAGVSTAGSRHDSGISGIETSSAAGSARQPTPLAPWSAYHQDPGGVELDTVPIMGGESVVDTSDEDNIVEGLKRGVERALSVVGMAPSPSGNSSAHGFNSSSAHGFSNSYHDLLGSRHSSVNGTVRGVGYEAAMANWPAGKIPGEPAWQEWGPAKKVTAHFITASGLALIVAFW